jgi:starch synthase (maltosyl-transferring)
VGGVLTPIVVDDVRPRTPSGFPAKGVVGERLVVSARLIADGHDQLGARLRWRRQGARTWKVEPLTLGDSDHWTGAFLPQEIGIHQFVIEAWTNRYATWRHEVELKVAAGLAVDLELEEGALVLRDLAEGVAAGPDRDRLLAAAAAVVRTSCSLDVRLGGACDDAIAALAARIPDTRVSESAVGRVWVDRERAAVGAWYELFPRSFGGLAGAAAHLDYVADLGFDVVYLPPVHPIGRTNRKGRDNTLVAAPDDPGSPWAIGAAAGGHEELDPGLGTWQDFDAFVARAGELGLEVALDYALQCSPDHPWVRDHPEWFRIRPDGSVRHAENPPKKYEDIHPIEFWPADDADRIALWEACRHVLDVWIARGVRIFRVDNPHTKPLAFWEWLLADVRGRHPDTVFLAEAFTAPAMMAKLAEIGFSQSYTYFTWRTAAWELRDYVVELTQGPLADYMRPAFWPNTPDILSGPLRRGPRAAFALRLVLAATLVPTYGIYSGYELCENEPASDTNEEYANSEKYELKDRDYAAFDSLAPVIRRINEVRRNHPGVWALRDIRFHHSDNDQVLVYSRGHASDGLLLCIVNLDPVHAQDTTVRLDLGAVGLSASLSYQVVDEFTGDAYTWRGDANFVRLDPAAGQVAHLFSVVPITR